MIAIPAVALRNDRLIRHVRGDSASSSDLPVDASGMAKSLFDLGFERLHLADAAPHPGHESQASALEEIVRQTDARLQVAGASSWSTIEQWFQTGADYVVVGARAIEDPDWLAEMADLYPQSVVVASDVRDRRVVRRGWVRTIPVDILDVIEELNSLPIAGVLVDGLHLDAASRDADLALVDDIAEHSRAPVLVAVQLGTLDDLRALEHRGAAGAVLGSEQLLNGVLDARAVASEFGA
jgi:phosphoribosylformimino-5-aminoimidazole carboxamide ribotide isomerase